MKVSKVLAKDREIRDAKFGYGFVAAIFGLWFLLRLPGMFYLLTWQFSLFQKSVAILISISILGVFVLALKRNYELDKLREGLAKDPEKYLGVKISGPPVLNTIIPFILK